MLRDELIVVGDRRGGVADITLELPQVELRDRASVEFLLRQPVRLLARRERAFGDIEVEVQLPELEIAGDHIADEREHDESPTVLFGQQIGAGLRTRATEPSPEVELP